MFTPSPEFRDCVFPAEMGTGGGVEMAPWYGGYVGVKKGSDCERLSAASMAARVRRRKISEKTMELGKMVPGGYKMNTAEMFQAAFKYVKFLQAQIGVLKLMSSFPVSVTVVEVYYAVLIVLYY